MGDSGVLADRVVSIRAMYADIGDAISKTSAWFLWNVSKSALWMVLAQRLKRKRSSFLGHYFLLRELCGFSFSSHPACLRAFPISYRYLCTSFPLTCSRIGVAFLDLG